MDFKSLGHTGSKPSKTLETFPTPKGFSGSVTFKTNEFTSVCPVTGQPDFSTITIIFDPDLSCLESKSLKLYLMTFREEGSFAEQLAATICQDVMTALDAKYVQVTVDQAPRGGIGLTASSRLFRNSMDEQMESMFQSMKMAVPA